MESPLKLRIQSLEEVQSHFEVQKGLFLMGSVKPRRIVFLILGVEALDND